ncbi:hypothetical protein Lal_00023147 [Lupinus albus]|uniref:Uncharacterized protein n=1 Tax=Lupinus albus TaxID=3870 RepID=A0A6A5N1M6_LUPAL|nr:hypothetical protein Lalb_Chr20g0110971 [Lupinus albus]KAF1881114.1 hypothetical protein Lal_00023147 [Lupinus albus]
MDAIINFELRSYDINTILCSNSKSPTAKKIPTYTDILMNKVSSEALSSPDNNFFQSQPLRLILSNSSISTFCGNNQNPSGGGNGLLSGARTSGIAINGNNTSLAMLNPSQGSQESQSHQSKFCVGRPPTMKLIPTMYQYVMKKRSSEASTSRSLPNEQPLNKQMRMSSSNFFSFQSNPSITGVMIPNQGANVEQPLTRNNSSSTLHGSENHNLLQSNNYDLGGLTGTESRVGTNDNSIGNNGAMIPNQDANVEQPLTHNNSSSTLHGSQNHNLMQSCSYNLGGLTGTGSRVGANDNSIDNNVAMIPNQGANVEQLLTHNNPSSTLHGSQNHNLVQSCTYNLGGLTGTRSRVGANDNSIGNNVAMIPNQGANVEQLLTHNNSSSTLHGSQNHNLMQSCSYNLGGLTRTGSRVGTNVSSIGNNDVMIPNQGANVEQPLTQNNPHNLGLGIGQDFQSPTQAQHNQLNDIINNGHHYILNNNQSLPQNPNLSFTDCNLPELPSYSEIQLSPLVGTGLQDIDAAATATQEHDDADIFLNNQSFPQSPSLTLVQHEGNQNLDLKNDLTSNLPSENSSKSSFSTSFLNLHSETNTTSLNQVLEYQDPNSSNDSFQNPNSETNTSPHGNMIMTEKQCGLDSSQCVSNLGDLSHHPISETNIGSQILTLESQKDLNISEYLSESYAVEEETDWICHFGIDLGQQ